MAESKKYYKGIEELSNGSLTENLAANEFASDLSTDEFLGDKEQLESSSTSRRDFLKYVGFSTAAATLAACEAPIIESIPYVVAPEELVPGVPDYYATSYYDGHDFASVLIKTREGRPIKVENNDLAAINGSANARVHASVLNLYDATRLQAPMIAGEKASWGDFDKSVVADLEKAVAAGKEVAVLTSTVLSPTTKKLLADFAAKYSTFKHYQYDAFSYGNKLDAIAKITGKRAFPTYKFEKASVIASFGADFLGDWTGQSVSGDYAKRRIPGKDMSRHLQFEANMSLTGANADQRYKMSSTEVKKSLLALYNEIAKAKGATAYANVSVENMAAVKSAAKELVGAGKNALVVSGFNDANVETITYAINELLGNADSTIDWTHRTYFRQGSDKDMTALLADMNASKVGALIINGVNPAYRLEGTAKWSEAVAKVNSTIYIGYKNDETAMTSKYVGAAHHNLESWGDAMPMDGAYALTQPTIRPLFDTRQFEDCLLAWCGNTNTYHQYLSESWNSSILSGGAWTKALHDGVYMSTSAPMEMMEESSEVEEVAVDYSSAANGLAKLSSKGIELNFYQKTAMGVGNVANNPWLLELPDPITRVTWDNYITVAAADAVEMGLMNKNQSNGALNGSKVRINLNGMTLENVPVLIQPGQAIGTIGLAVGYGRQGAGKAADGVGVNAFAMMNGSDVATNASLELMEGEHEFACTQLAHTMMGRKIVNETNLSSFLNEDPTSWNEKPVFETHQGAFGSDKVNLWDDFDHETGHFWNMSIDLNTCTGCGACVIACHAENNVPVVGKEEVRKSRDMHWLRIDRYFSSDMTDEVADKEGVNSIDKFAEMEKASASPDVFFQPVMCQHCNHAPCETVCPVAATTHSAEGLNHMTYNRCIGTRYCANNCPYKVRRFNWFEYHNNDKFNVNYSMNDDLGRMVLNPDVTVRSRGVMEKCSMCIQRTQYGKLEAKKSGRALKDGDIKTACQSACDTGAIAFGDVNDKDSKVFAMKQDKRMYHLLEEVGTQPSVFYQTKVRNRA